MNDEPVVIFITCGTREEAERIAETLVRRQLAACGNILPDITSIFRWKQNIEHEQETLLIVKSKQRLFDRIAEQVRMLHSYETPEIIALPIIDGSPDYLAWLSEETSTE